MTVQEIIESLNVQDLKLKLEDRKVYVGKNGEWKGGNSYDEITTLQALWDLIEEHYPSA